jgi:6,7-dimethyl-8-ribityllumazine synthase
MSRFNQDIGEGLLSACTSELKRLGVDDGSIAIATVPGALEIPLVLQTMARSGRFRGPDRARRGHSRRNLPLRDCLQRLLPGADGSADQYSGVPIANGILTCEDDDQAIARMHQKGSDCAQVAVEMANLLGAIGGQS